MRLSRVWPLQHPDHFFFPLLSIRLLDSLLEGIVKRHGVRHGLRLPEGEAHVPQVVDRHACADDDNVLLAEGLDGFAEEEVGLGVFRVEEGHLDEGHSQRVGGRGEGHVEAGEDAVVEAAGEASGADVGFGEEGDDVGG